MGANLSKEIQKHRRRMLMPEMDASGEEVRQLLRYRPGTLTDLMARTKFSKKELQMLYRGFKESCPSGVVDSDQFKDIYAQFFPQGDPSRYAMFVFNTFDGDNNGNISFEEFCVGLSVLSRGTFDEKMQWVYKLYDVDQDGILTRSDVTELVSSLYAMLGSHVEPPVTTRDINRHVDHVFDKMDTDRDCVITVDEFIRLGQIGEVQDSLASLFNTRFCVSDKPFSSCSTIFK